MKRYIPYITVVAFQIILDLIYSLLPYDIVPTLIYFFSVFVPFFILYLSSQESINGRGSGSATFTKADGSYGKVALMDERAIICDDDKSV